ncbi:uncharacterized protein LOC125804776 [Astyanax mexicanus]|uniref:uncharacterized protein LOC125804776 n=1 Tax=Astyanax mexicanus TaxID=7994 RepID=UPI0020CABC33|nr:uncharacterized protein LOC125804776 [Astyanax mexicanus]
MMSSAWLLFLFLQKIYAAEAVVHYEPSLISVRSGSSVTLQCRLDQRTSYSAKSWYMQKLGQEPKELVIRLANKTEPIYSTGSNRLNMNGNFLTIKKASKEDEGIYFCGGTKTNNVVFSSGMFLTVTGHPQFSISVLQTPASGLVPPGEAVNLQCTVTPNVSVAELRVSWIRSAAGSSFPEIIFTHHNSSSSSRQCEISSSKDNCFHTFSKIVLNNENNSGTYYCAVVTSNEIVFSAGATLDFNRSDDRTTFSLEVAFGVSVIWIVAQAVLICKRTQCKHCRGLQEKPASQGHYTSSRLRLKRGRSDVNSKVQYSTFTDHQTH